MELGDGIEDQADVDARRQQEILEQRKKEMEKRSQVIQRGLPRPTEVNLNILRPVDVNIRNVRPAKDSGLTDHQIAEELIKREMLTMMQYDAVQNPTITNSKKANSLISGAQNYLDHHPYEDFGKDELGIARDLISEEMEIVKKGMAHGELSIEAYTTVWEECSLQILFVENQKKFTRANLAAKKEKIDAAERKLEENRRHMTGEAKQAAKMEKKLKILTGGYQTRAQVLAKQLHDICEQNEQAQLELSTFKFLQSQEEVALSRRINGLTEDVNRQIEREKCLQMKYAELQEQLPQEMTIDN